MGGAVGCAWEFDHFSPAGSIPSKVNLTRCAGGSQDVIDTLPQTIMNEIETGPMTPRIGRVFQLDDIAEGY